MCRHLAWLGAPRTLADLLLDQPSSLRRQSYAPRRQHHGRVNADGWGVGWWTSAAPTPARWRSATPMWSHASLAAVAPHVSSTCILAAVRSATPGMPIEEAASAPFAHGEWLLSHNGRVDRSVLPPTAWQAAESVCDSAVLATHLLSAPAALAERIAAVGFADPAARLNVLLADGTQLLATTWGDTLAVLVTADGVAVASEPYDDDPRWRDVPDRSLLTVTASGVAVHDLPDPRGETVAEMENR